MTDTPESPLEGQDPRLKAQPAYIEPPGPVAPPRASEDFAFAVGQALAEYPNERILRFDVILTMMPTQAGLMAVAVVYVEAATMVIGSVMGLVSQPVEPPKLLNPQFLEVLARDLVQGIRDTRAQESMETNGHGDGIIDLTQVRRPGT